MTHMLEPSPPRHPDDANDDENINSTSTNHQAQQHQEDSAAADDDMMQMRELTNAEMQDGYIDPASPAMFSTNPYSDTVVDWLVVHDTKSRHQQKQQQQNNINNSNNNNNNNNNTHSHSHRYVSESAGLGGEIQLRCGNNGEKDDEKICWFLLEPRNRILIEGGYGVVVTSDGVVRSAVVIPDNNGFLFVAVAASDGTYIQRVSPGGRQTSLLFSAPGDAAVGVVDVSARSENNDFRVAAILENGDVIVIDLNTYPSQVVHRVSANTAISKAVPDFLASGLSLLPRFGSRIKDAVTIQTALAVAASADGSAFAVLREHSIQVWDAQSCRIIAEHSLLDAKNRKHKFSQIAIDFAGNFVAVVRDVDEETDRNVNASHHGRSAEEEENHYFYQQVLYQDGTQNQSAASTSAIDIYKVTPQTDVYDRPFYLNHSSVFFVPIPNVQRVSVFSDATIVAAGARRVCIGAFRNTFVDNYKVSKKEKVKLLFDKSIPHDTPIISACRPTETVSKIFSAMHHSDFLDDAGCYVRLTDMNFEIRIDFRGIPSAALRRFSRLVSQMAPNINQRFRTQRRQKLLQDPHASKRISAACDEQTSERLRDIFNNAFRVIDPLDSCQLLVRAICYLRLRNSEISQQLVERDQHLQEFESLFAFFRAAIFPRSIERSPIVEHPVQNPRVRVQFSLLATSLKRELDQITNHFVEEWRKLLSSSSSSSVNNNQFAEQLVPFREYCNELIKLCSIDIGNDWFDPAAAAVTLEPRIVSKDQSGAVVALQGPNDHFSLGDAVTLQAMYLNHVVHVSIRNFAECLSALHAINLINSASSSSSSSSKNATKVSQDGEENIADVSSSLCVPQSIIESDAMPRMIQNGTRHCLPQILRRVLVDYHTNKPSSSSSSSLPSRPLQVIRDLVSPAANLEIDVWELIYQKKFDEALEMIQDRILDLYTLDRGEPLGPITNRLAQEGKPEFAEIKIALALVEKRPSAVGSERSRARNLLISAIDSAAMSLMKSSSSSSASSSSILTQTQKQELRREEALKKLRPMFERMWKIVAGDDANAVMSWLIQFAINKEALEIAALASEDVVVPFINNWHHRQQQYQQQAQLSGNNNNNNLALSRQQQQTLLAPHIAWWMFKTGKNVDGAVNALCSVVSISNNIPLVPTRMFLAQCAVECATSQSFRGKEQLPRVLALQQHVLAQKNLLDTLKCVAQIADVVGGGSPGNNNNNNNNNNTTLTIILPFEVINSIESFIRELEHPTSGVLHSITNLQQWCAHHHHNVPGVGACELVILKARVAMAAAVANALDYLQQQQQYNNGMDEDGYSNNNNNNSNNDNLMTRSDSVSSVDPYSIASPTNSAASSYQQIQQLQALHATEEQERYSNIAAWCGAFEAAVMNPLAIEIFVPALTMFAGNGQQQQQQQQQISIRSSATSSPVLNHCIDVIASLGKVHGVSLPFVVSFVEAVTANTKTNYPVSLKESSDNNSNSGIKDEQQLHAARTKAYLAMGITSPMLVSAMLTICDIVVLQQQQQSSNNNNTMTNGNDTANNNNNNTATLNNSVGNITSNNSSSSSLSDLFGNTRLTAPLLFLRAARYFMELQGSADPDDMRRAFSALDARVKKMYANARTGSRAVSREDRMNLDEANRVLLQAEATLMDLDSLADGGRSKSFVF